MVLAIPCFWASFSLPTSFELPERPDYPTEVEAIVTHLVCQNLQAPGSLPVSGLLFDLSDVDLEGTGD